MRARSVRPRFEELESRLLLKGPADAPPLGAPPAPGPGVIWVDTVPELQSAVANLQSNQTIVIETGMYNLTQTLYVGNGSQVTNVLIRGETDNPNDVVLRGKGMNNPSFGSVPHGFSFYNAQDVRIANLSIGEVWFHPLDLQGGQGADRISIYHVRVYDGGEQLLKANPGSGGADNCVVEYSTFEYTAGPPLIDHGGGTGYTNAIDVFEGDNWIIRHNLIRNFHVPDGYQNIWNPAILMWAHSANTLVEGNTFIDTDRAIAFGLFDDSPANHSGGIIRNNFLYMSPGLFSAARKAGSDAPIIVWDSPGSKVYHNTIINNGNHVRSVEVRFAGSTAEVRNNLADAPLGTRDGGSITQGGNYLLATATMFVDPATGNLHLLDNTATRNNVIDRAAALATITDDWDGNARAASGNVDIGADEFVGGNQPPVANDDAASTRGTNSVNVGVLANDSDVDGDTLNVTDVSAPAHGSAVLNADGTIKYTANAGYVGGDTFNYTISDGKGGTDSATVTIDVQEESSVGYEDDPWNPGLQALVVRGTSGNDVVALTPVSGGKVRVDVNGVNRGEFAVISFTRIRAFGNAGNDDIRGAGSLGVRLELDGGLGRDTLRGSNGADVLLGREGADSLFGANGRDILIAGAGSDLLRGGNTTGTDDSDLLIAGTTAYDNDAAALKAIFLEWTSARTYAERTTRLATGADSLPVLNLTTVFDDAALDRLWGGAANDWFFASGSDVLNDRKSAERVN